MAFLQRKRLHLASDVPPDVIWSATRTLKVLETGCAKRCSHGGMTVRLGTAIGVDPEFLSTAAGSVISRSMLLPVPP